MSADPPDSSSRPCPRCGTVVAPGARFCGHCGLTMSTEVLPSPASRPDDAGPSVGADARGDLVRDFSLGARLLGQHPIMIVPPVIAMAVVFVAVLLIFGGAMSMFALGGFSSRRPLAPGAALGTAVVFLFGAGVAMVANLISSAVVVVMARDALEGRAPVMGAAYGTVITRLGDVIGASFLCALIIGVTSLFLLIPGLVAAFFFMFTMPVVLLEGAGPTAGLRRSAGLVGENFGRVAGLVGGLMAAAFVTWVASIALHFVPVVGRLASVVMSAVFLAYVTIVIVRVFQTLPRR